MRTLPSRPFLLTVPFLALAMALTACGDDDEDGGGATTQVPIPQAASELSAATMSGEEATDFLFLDPGGQLAAQGEVTVRVYEVDSPVEAVLEFYEGNSDGWEQVFTTAFDSDRILIWERDGGEQTAWISVTQGTDNTSLVIIQGGSTD